MKTDPEIFILEQTTLLTPPLVPEIRLHLASDAHELWQKTEDELEEIDLAPPFWAFAWAGGQALARHILDNPSLVAGKSVADFASGSGLVAIAAAKAGASAVLAIDIDPWAQTAIRLNAAMNAVTIDYCAADRIGTLLDADVILAGDVFYDQDLARRLTIWFSRLTREGKVVLIGDPGRAYCPKVELEAISIHQVPVTLALEDSDFKETTIWRFIAT